MKISSLGTAPGAVKEEFVFLVSVIIGKGDLAFCVTASPYTVIADSGFPMLCAQVGPDSSGMEGTVVTTLHLIIKRLVCSSEAAGHAAVRTLDLKLMRTMRHGALDDGFVVRLQGGTSFEHRLDLVPQAPRRGNAKAKPKKPGAVPGLFSFAKSQHAQRPGKLSDDAYDAEPEYDAACQAGTSSESEDQGSVRGDIIEEASSAADEGAGDEAPAAPEPPEAVDR